MAVGSDSPTEHADQFQPLDSEDTVLKGRPLSAEGASLSNKVVLAASEPHD